MSRARAALALLALPLLGGCLATRRDVQDLQSQMETMRASQEQLLRELERRQAALLDSLSSQQLRTRGDLATRLLAIERQMVQIQELTGQGQQQLSQLRRQLDQAQQQELLRRAEAATADTSGSDAAPAPERPAPASNASAEETFNTATAALRRGSLATARSLFEDFLRAHPQHRLAPDAQFSIGETWAGRDPARALAAYARVVELYPNSTRAPTALLRAGLIETARGNRTEARARFNQVVRAYPRSPDATQARAELRRLGTE